MTEIKIEKRLLIDIGSISLQTTSLDKLTKTIRTSEEYIELQKANPLNYEESGSFNTKDDFVEHFPLHVSIKARIDHVRQCGKKMVFILLRQKEKSLQVLFREDIEQYPNLTREMIKSYGKLSPESIVTIKGILVRSPVKIETPTISHYELMGYHLEQHSSSGPLPIQIYKPDALLETRLNHRVLDLRNQKNQIIFQIEHQVLQRARTFLVGKNFMEIKSPKLLGYASESGSEVFKVDYFEKEAFLAQSPQFYKQMAINAGFERVFEIGPVFRAEKSHSSRHLTEFTGIDMEMEITDRIDVIRMLYELVKAIFIDLYSDNLDLFELWNKISESHFDVPLIPDTNEPVTITYKDAVKMMEEKHVEIESPEDLNYQDQLNLAKLVKEKYNTDIFLLDKFPMNLRPFYTETDPEDSSIGLAYDFIFRGKEILSGAQRVNDYTILLKRLKKTGNSQASIQDYLDSFKYGSPKHGGGGFGLERLIGAYFNIENVRNFSLFPRDPLRLNP